MKLFFKLPRFILHIIGWIVYILYEVFILLVTGNKANVFALFCFYSLDFIFFYCHSYGLLKFTFSKKNPWLYFFPLIILEFAIYTLMTFGMDILVNSVHKGQLTIELYYEDFARAIWRFVLVVVFSTCYWLVLRAVAYLRKEAELRSAYMSAQLNTHLLFNTLNFVYNTVEGVSDKGARAIILLSDVMRYALTSGTEQGVIALKEEVSQLKDYIMLNQLRFNNKLNVTLNIDKAAYQSELLIPTLLLITLLENMFKHGDLTNPKHKASFELKLSQNELVIHTSNCKRPNRNLSLRSGGMGLTNIKQRLQQLYKQHFLLSSIDKEDIFITDLKIQV